MLCAIPACENHVRALGLCNKHYVRQRKHGSPYVVLVRRPCVYCGLPYDATSARQVWCPICVPDKRARARMRRYGISEPDYQKLLAEQSYRCAICREACGTGEALAVDHDHKTDVVRGLLCRRCNMILHYVENLAFFEAAGRYLRAASGSIHH